MATIYANRIELDSDYYQEKGGILNALSFASAQYIYRVVERHTRREDIKQFNNEKLRNLRRAIVHKNAHLDEYFAEAFVSGIPAA